MTRPIATALATVALLLAGCGAAPTAVRSVTRTTGSVQAHYLVFQIKSVQTKPAPAGVPFTFAEVAIVGVGMIPKTAPVHIAAAFTAKGDKVTVALTREGKPMSADDRVFYLQQLVNTLEMGAAAPALEVAINEVLKWTGFHGGDPVNPMPGGKGTTKN